MEDYERKFQGFEIFLKNKPLDGPSDCFVRSIRRDSVVLRNAGWSPILGLSMPRRFDIQSLVELQQLASIQTASGASGGYSRARSDPTRPRRVSRITATEATGAGLASPPPKLPRRFPANQSSYFLKVSSIDSFFLLRRHFNDRWSFFFRLCLGNSFIRVERNIYLTFIHSQGENSLEKEEKKRWKYMYI